ncbi:MAG: DUF5658 family protein [Longimicrobiales bacterium]
MERRTHVLFTDWRWALRGRRIATRRYGENAELGTDVYEPSLFLIAIAILLLSAADATFTLMLLGSGHAFEANPLMRALIHHDEQLFVNLKLVLTAAGLLFMVVCADMRLLRVFRVRYVMLGLLFAYAGLVAYEVTSLIRMTLF